MPGSMNFKAFNKIAKDDQFDREVKLRNGNVTGQDFANQDT